MILFANAKINLGLQITGKRPDGYHNLETILYPVPFYDVIEFRTSEKFSLHLYGQNLPEKIEENLVSKAFQLIKNNFSIPEIEIQLLKNIPPGTGLGGGSSDAAHILSGLNQMFELNLTTEQLRQMAETLGSDCSFFIENKPALATGKGEILEKINLNLADYFLVLAVPQIKIATAEAYSLLKEPYTHPVQLREILSKPIEEWSTVLTNDFEEVVFSKHWELLEIKNNFTETGALYTSLTGSGSAIYGIYKKRPSFKKRRPQVQYFIFQL